MAMALPVPHFTIDMLETFPDDGNRYELLEGMLLVTPAPSTAHQIVAGRLHVALAATLEQTGLAHVVAPGAIQRGGRTQLQPDILVFSTAYAPTTHWREIREWWLAVEVLSRSSRIYDRDVKRAAYLALGVAEYWIADPRDCAVDVWTLGEATSRRVTESLHWHPAALAEGIIIDLSAVFRDIRGDDEDPSA